VVSPGCNHRSPTLAPHENGIGSVEIQIACDLFQLILALETVEKTSSTCLVLLRLTADPSRYKFISSAYSWSITSLPSEGRLRPLTTSIFSRSYPRESATNRYRKGARGQPCRIDLDSLKGLLVCPFRPTEHHESVYSARTQVTQVALNPSCVKVPLRKLHSTLSYAFSKSRRSITIG
jgi:hypothetical protein